MYTPPGFVEDDQETLHDFMRAHSFATLISVTDSEPLASHLPLLLDAPTAGPARLIGHLARANPQWETADGQEVLAIFHGPHAYISPTWFEAEQVVPTWNYLAVHAYGKFSIETAPDRLRDIVERYVDFYEAGLPQPWSLQSAPGDFVEKLLAAIVGFTVEITRLEGKWKLNQNHDSARREKVIRQLQAAGGENQQRIADLMAETLHD